MKKIIYISLILIFVFLLKSFPLVWAQQAPGAAQQPLQIPEAGGQTQPAPAPVQPIGVPHTVKSNAVCTKVGDPGTDKPAICTEIQPGFVGPIQPQVCGQDPTGQPIMCIKPGYVFYCQGDPQWGNICSLGAAGCGPTTMAMIFSAYGDTITPPDMDKIFQQRGWRVCGDNPSSMEAAIQTLLPESGYEQHALGAPLNLDRAQEYLNAGYLIIGSTKNHIFVIDGVDTSDPNNPKLRLRDPGRCENKDGVLRPASVPWNGESLNYSYAIKKVK